MLVPLTLLFLFLQYAIIASAQAPPTGVLFYGCYSWTPAGPTDRPLQSCPPAAVFEDLYYSRCVCNKMVDLGGFTYLNCTSFQKPSDSSFTSLCTYTQIMEENTCSSITDIDNFTHTACSGVISVSNVTGALCSNKKPVGHVVDVLNKFAIGRIVANMLMVACGANSTKSDVNAICTGIDTLSTGCSSNSAGESASSNLPLIIYAIGVPLISIMSSFLFGS
ncbi:hypothetical protein BDN72DRAFT_413564 [Pluteus cervinus]|uniref:Uncharacterized protein n=1 Tax=Pluteus cervinus TaxID=181527 RepID=A0ACD3A9E1_9AGAR|nr:hypothetical protein BDN72DRAFT_413564 [Pluteus cervinus]